MMKNKTIITSAILLLYAGTASAATPTFEQTAQNMLHSLGSIGGLMEAIAVILGVGMFLGGFFRLKLYGQMRGTFMAHQVTIAGPLVKMLAGILLLVLPTLLKTAMLAFWGTASPMAYSSSNGSSPWAAYTPVVIMFVRVIGVAAFIRGITMLPRTAGQGKQPGVMSKALLHMVGGVLCINVVATHALLASILPV